MSIFSDIDCDRQAEEQAMYSVKETKARLKTVGTPECPPCDVCGVKAGAVIELGDPCQGQALCTLHYRRFLDARYAAMGRPVTGAELERRAAAGVVV